MLEGQIHWRRRFAREWLIALGCFLAIVALNFVVSDRTQSAFQLGGLEGLRYGDFWYWVVGLYGVIQIMRLTLWSIRTSLWRPPN
jgi:hypothetical protein